MTKQEAEFKERWLNSLDYKIEEARRQKDILNAKIEALLEVRSTVQEMGE